jgi:hypothetical protein
MDVVYDVALLCSCRKRSCRKARQLILRKIPYHVGSHLILLNKLVATTSKALRIPNCAPSPGPEPRR